MHCKNIQDSLSICKCSPIRHYLYSIHNTIQFAVRRTCFSTGQFFFVIQYIKFLESQRSNAVVVLPVVQLYWSAIKRYSVLQYNVTGVLSAIARVLPGDIRYCNAPQANTNETVDSTPSNPDLPDVPRKFRKIFSTAK